MTYSVFSVQNHLNFLAALKSKVLPLMVMLPSVDAASFCRRRKSKRPPPLTTVGQSAKTPLSVFCIVSVKKIPKQQLEIETWLCAERQKKSSTRAGKCPFPSFSVGRKRISGAIHCVLSKRRNLCSLPKTLANVFWPRLLGLSGKLFTGIKSKFLAYFGTECVLHALKVDSLCFWWNKLHNTAK